MNMFYFKWACLVAFGLHQGNASSTVIYPEIADEKLNSNVTFRCTHSGQGFRIRWKTNSWDSICSFELNQCPSSTLFTDKGYNCTCEKDGLNGTNAVLHISNITAAYHNTSWTCEVIYMHYTERVSASLLVKVPVVKINMTPSVDVMTVIEHSKIQLNCTTSFSRPIPKVNWIIAQTDGEGIINIPENDVDFNNENGFTSVTSMFDYLPNRTVNGWKVYCTVSITEIQLQEIRSSHVLLNVTYPPWIDPIEDSFVAEGSAFNFTCPVHHGNPDNTFVGWTRDGDNRNWTSQNAFINNITKYDDMNYNCTAYNIMSSSNDNYTVQGITIQIFHLNVEYKADVYDFYVDGYLSDKNITVKEGDNVTFLCYVDSKPLSNTTITIRHKQEEYMTIGKANISYTRWYVNCFDAGEYVCSVRNKHNIEERSSQILYIEVICSPMSNPLEPVAYNITTRGNDPAVFSYSCLAYPLPTIVVWRKFNGSDSTSLTTDSDIKITQLDLNFSLTIKNVLRTDIGLYKLTIGNKVGSIEQIFTLEIEDKPDPPSGFHAIAELITESTIAVQWLPSFNGGRPQHFVLNYSKSGLDWIMRVVPSSGDALYNLTLKGLSGGTFYRLLLYSENVIGRSKLSDVLYIQTKLSPVKESDFSVVGIAIGSGIGVGFSSLGFLAGVWIFKKRSKRNKNTGVSYVNMKNEKRKQQKEEDNVYDQIDVYNKDQINKETCKIVTGDDNDHAIYYQKLKPTDLDKNQYNQLPSMTEDIPDSDEAHASSMEGNAILEICESTYINLI
ncbi:synaptogenesis protein syg-2-like [Ruditapes philippinarum]|uniref:synaptogenesis protein syg-2-like n=1 Tax=Ruditapes philippinarum TaxID=129788 RepID=UPI00295BD191|nr:synaptogenesis protein syg-2-like [Ruditapes philippinarum]